MKKNPFTIQTFFPTGDTRNFHINHVPTRTIQSIVIPRAEVSQAIKSRSELNYNGIYFLFEEEGYLQSNGETMVYIGESEDVAERLKSHVTKKQNWAVAIIFTTTSSTNQLTKADIKYLENYCYQKALEANRYKLQQNIPKKSFVSESREADLNDIFQSISTLLSFSGYPIFIPVNNEKNQEIFYLKARNSDAKAIYTVDGLTVLKNSRISPLSEGKGFVRQKLLNQLTNSGVISNEGIFLKDYTFSAPSTASDILAKGSYNGWTSWKNKNNQTLDEVTNRSTEL